MPTQSISFSATNLPAAGTFVKSANVNDTINALINDYNLQIGTNKIADAAVTAAKIAAEAFTSWTPAVTTTNSNFTLGNGTATGQYIQYGKLIFVNFLITFGSTTTFGTGEFRITVPVNISTNSQRRAAGGLVCLTDTGIVAYTSERVDLSIGATTFAITTGSSASRVGPTNPFTMGNGDIIEGHFWYEAA